MKRQWNPDFLHRLLEERDREEQREVTIARLATHHVRQSALHQTEAFQCLTAIKTVVVSISRKVPYVSVHLYILTVTNQPYGQAEGVIWNSATRPPMYNVLLYQPVMT